MSKVEAKKFGVRMLSALGIFLSFLLFVWLGGHYLAGFLIFISITGFLEVTGACKVREVGTKKLTALEWIGIIFIVLYYAATVYAKEEFIYQLFVIVFFFFAIMACYVFTFPKYKTNQITSTLFAFLYVPVMLSFFYLTRMYDTQYKVVCITWMTVIVAWTCDSFAYLVGSRFGKHKLTPVLSPKKSIEGAIGGTLGAGICNGIFGIIYFTSNHSGYGDVWKFVLVGCIGAAFSQIGDLAASAIKRNHDVKDYGHIIPGHGGIMDRFDSFIAVAPMIYLLLKVTFR